MTYREKLKLEYPEKINRSYIGGCKGCPKDYGYEDEYNLPYCSFENCKECWDREIPESDALNCSETLNCSDLISRQAAIDALMAAIDDVGILDGADIKVVFDNLPSAQPEIIYCKDCNNLKSDEYHHWCKSHGGFFNPEKDFCSRAERRTE